jgi:hypothetical protein
MHRRGLFGKFLFVAFSVFLFVTFNILMIAWLFSDWGQFGQVERGTNSETLAAVATIVFWAAGNLTLGLLNRRAPGRRNGELPISQTQPPAVRGSSQLSLAIFWKRLIVVLGGILLAVIAFCAFVAPSNTVVTLAIAVYLGALIIALSGILQVEFASLRDDVKHLREEVKGLSQAEQSRFMKELKSVSAVPASSDLSAGDNGNAADPKSHLATSATTATQVACDARRVQKEIAASPLVDDAGNDRVDYA